MAYTSNSKIDQLDELTTPDDTDVAVLGDQSDSDRAKKITWTNIKATLKTYFDTLYASTASIVTNGNSHDHSGGDGAQISHTGLSSIGTNTHDQIDTALSRLANTSGTNTGDQTISDTTISLTDITTNNVSTSKHGFVPKAPNDTAQYLRGDGSWATPTGSGDVSSNTATSVDGELVLFNATSGKSIKRGNTLTGVLRADSGVVSADTDITDIVSSASDTVAGKIEIATASETTTGTDTGRAVSPDGLAGSVYGKRVMQIKLADDATAVTTGDGKVIVVIPEELNGYNLVGAHAMVSTVSSSGTPTYQIRNVTDSQDMLSTRITIDASEYTSYSAATAPAINTSYDDVATGDRIAVDKDVAGTGEKGDTIVLVFQLP